MEIAITGVTGNLGGQVARAVSEAGFKARLLARSPERAPQLEGATVYQAAYENTESVRQALTGVDVLFMVSAKENPLRVKQHLDFVDAAKEAGVKHIVYTSFYNAADDSTFTLARDHAKTEKHIKDLGLTYTFIRDNFYLEFFLDMLKEYGEIKGPAGLGKCSAVSRRDVSAVASKILTQPQNWENQTLNMTGPDDLNMEEIVARINKIESQNFVYIDETVEEAYESRKVWPAEQWEYDSWVSTYTAIKRGEQAGLSTDIERVLGRKPISLEDVWK
ncbi:SDR family oxidoreductase [Streptococcus loxodontisalivarius]|uniref:Uncharacterized protein YbjT (DUF2867 family) n=1 Tax=Streptococcus loxodontisalivarius TaxID=1349415 RepID=A0ABS2PTV8_9STRE|nr:uncharacterized protein YbjT (DUF2867 family) [Streptococcus loxodontisalivarius]